MTRNKNIIIMIVLSGVIIMLLYTFNHYLSVNISGYNIPLGIDSLERRTVWTISPRYPVLELFHYVADFPLYKKKKIHFEDKVELVQDQMSVAIGGGLKISKCAKSRRGVRSLERLPIVRLISTFCKTASRNFRYYFIFVFDFNDQCLSQDEYRKDLLKLLWDKIVRFCPKNLVKGFDFTPCDYNGKPAWAQNDAMMIAYWRNITYFYRINDDTYMTTEDWTNSLVQSLMNFNPTYLGVTGPTHHGGNERILTYDFVHRTHIDVLGYYYPRQFPDWYADGWITLSYDMIDRINKVPSVKIRHTQGMGQRYKAHRELADLKAPLVNATGDLLLQWLSFIELSSTTTDYNKQSCLNVITCEYNIISFTLHSTDSNFTMGALRNLMLAKRLLPNWVVRIYACTSLPKDIIQFLILYGAELIFVNEQEISIPSSYWAHLVADDPNVTRFIVRNVTHRLSPRQTRLINDWQLSDHAYHTIRDRPWHSGMPLVQDLFGAVREHLVDAINDSMYNLISNAMQTNKSMNVENFIWSRIQNDASILVHDSVDACLIEQCIHFSKTIHDSMPIGVAVDQYEIPMYNSTDNYLSSSERVTMQ